MIDCTLVLPHFDDEYCGCRSIVESPAWNVKLAVFVTDSTTQFQPHTIPSTYYEDRLSESQNYLALHGCRDNIRVLDFPEQIWDNRIVKKNFIKVLHTLPLEGTVFVPYFNDAHADHKAIGRIFLHNNGTISEDVSKGLKVVYYKVHKLNPNGQVPAACYDDAIKVIDYDGVSTMGRAWNPEEFVKLYPSQSSQVPELECEEYIAQQHIPFGGARYKAYANPSSTA